MRRGGIFLGLLATLALCASACGSSGSSAPANTSAPTTAPVSTPSTGGSNLPSVANATDLKVAPAPAAGSQPAPTTLETQDLVVGSGPTATPTSTVKVQYVGANYANGQVFDSSWSRGQAATFPLNQVIPGFAQGIAGMKVGGRREIVIPPAQGYGAQGSPPAVGPNETLVFVVDLLGVQ
jgi:peptidylprolyl isomerase